MASFIYNAHKNTSYHSQWKDYLQKKEFHDDLANTFQSEAKSIRNSISDASFEIVGSLDDGFEDVINTLKTGFSKTSSQIENLSIMVDWRLSEVIDQLRISNLLQENIAILLRVPDFQKERQYFIEQGFKHYKNAGLDADLYEDSLKNLLEAEKREISDYIVLHRIGMIYLYAPKLLDLPKAEDYFRRAAKYAIVESNENAQQTLNLLAGNLKQDLSSQSNTPRLAKNIAAGSYFQAAVSCFAQEKFAEAVELSERAFSLSPYFLEAGFLQSKSLALIGNGEKSAEILRGLIEKQNFYAIKTVSDADFAVIPEIQTMLIQLRDSAVSNAYKKLIKLKSEAQELKKESVNYSQFNSILNKIELLIQRNTFLDALKALDEITKKHNWESSPFVTQLIKKFSKAYAAQNSTSAPRLNPKDIPPHLQNMPEHVKRRFMKQTDEKAEVIKEAIEIRKRWKGKSDFLQYLKVTNRTLEEFILFEKEMNQMEEEEKIRFETEEKQKKAKEEQRKTAEETQQKEEATNKQRQSQINELLAKAYQEEDTQNKKWLFKNYDLAIYYYEEAAKLGSNRAKLRLQHLRKS